MTQREHMPAVRTRNESPAEVRARAAEGDGPRPLLRGWVHTISAIGAIAVTLWLLWWTRNSPLDFVLMAIYGTSLCLLLSVSGMYHQRPREGKAHRFWRTWDHCNIYIYIAAVYTPICVLVLDGWLRPALLTATWVAAGISMLLQIFGKNLARWLRVGMYVLTGSIGLVLAPFFIARLSWAPALWLATAALIYVVGAVIYVKQQPNPFPYVYGSVELFHTLVTIACGIITAVLWFWVLPLPIG